MQIRVLVCGGRDFTDYELLSSYLIETFVRNLLDPEDVTIISGHAKGADKLGEKFANANGCKLLIFPADWDKHGKAAGPIRNQRMLHEGQPDLVVAFPTNSSKGTWHMIKIAEAAGVRTLVVEP